MTTDTNEQIATWVRDDTRRYCTRPWKEVAILSDGQVVCSSADMIARNPLGNLTTQSFDEIWSGERYESLRHAIATDIDVTDVCRGCPNRIAEPAPPENGVAVRKPKVLHIESAVSCNLDCSYMCTREPIEGSRGVKILDFDVFTRIIDDLSPEIIYVSFHMGGENWIHPRAAEMVRYIKDRNPKAYVVTSTNGHFFRTEDKLRAALLSGVDCFIYSIDGAHQDSYVQYRKNGDFDVAFQAMKRMVEVRKELGMETPVIVWRYILFKWNDSPEEMDRARAMAKEIEVDHLAWHLNAGPPEISGARYHVASPHLWEIKDELWDIIQTKLRHHDLRLGTYD